MDIDNTHFYKDKPLFGLDIGFSSIKVMQLEHHGDQHRVVGYGIGAFDSSAIKDGVIVDYESLAQATLNLFKKNIVGEITTKRVALGIPSIRTFTHTFVLPPIEDSELHEAVMLEAEQNIPVPIGELYLDYSVVSKNDKTTEILTVAIPKKIVDSHLNFLKILGLEPVIFDTSISAAGRLFDQKEEHSDIPAVLIDFGSISADITIRDKTNVITGTIPSGGDTFTEILAKNLNVSKEEAHVIKTKYGISKSKKQDKILEILKPELDQLVREVRRMIRYYEERSGSKSKVGQIITMGGGSNMPGLSGYLTDVLRLPVRMSEPWQGLSLHRLHAPNENEKSVYVTVAGLCFINPKEIF
ncbi:type IV pilus assembly protein PilM [Candidatus Saccharibacteria bacterium]|nr:type IV pilus assembly protein PilM [Candidatus Saccharibacteria bacterium]